MGSGDCERSKVGNITANLVKLSAQGLGRILCQQLKSSLNAAKILIQAQLVYLQQAVALEASFVQNFYIAPLSAVESIFKSVNDKVAAPLYALGIDKECRSHAKLHENIEAAQNPLKTVADAASNLKRPAVAHIENMRKRIDDLNAAISSIDELLNIQCP